MGEMEDYYWQLSYYAHLFIMSHPNVQTEELMCKLVFFFMDWNRKDAAIHKEKYPPGVCTTVTFKPATKEKTIAHMRQRIEKHSAILEKPEPGWPDAHPCKVWQRVKGYKVYATSNLQRAVKGGVFEGKDPVQCLTDAMTFMKTKVGPGHTLRKITTDRVRCRSYCPWNTFCTTYQRWLNENGQTPQPTYSYRVETENDPAQPGLI